MDRKYWAKGPWDNEPDLLRFKYKGFSGLIQRNGLGGLCGYVEIPLDHPILECLNVGKDGLEYEKLPLDVHGGITFGERFIDKESGKEYYLAGFDCGHSQDLIPFSTWSTNPDLPEELRMNDTVQQLIALEEKSFPFLMNRTYKDIGFVTKEIESMIDQIIEYKRTDETNS